MSVTHAVVLARARAQKSLGRVNADDVVRAQDLAKRARALLQEARALKALNMSPRVVSSYGLLFTDNPPPFSLLIEFHGVLTGPRLPGPRPPGTRPPRSPAPRVSSCVQMLSAPPFRVDAPLLPLRAQRGARVRAAYGRAH